MKDTSGPAFPLDLVHGAINSGLTKRQWYAGLAMRAMIAAGSYGGADKVAHDAFEQADAMIGEAEA